MDFSTDVKVPPRSRTFSEDDARALLALLKGEAEGQEKPAENVGYGTFDTAGAARSAGVTLNKLLQGLGAPHKYAVTAFKRDGKFVGVMWNKPAKTKADANGSATPATPAPARSGGRRRNR